MYFVGSSNPVGNVTESWLDEKSEIFEHCKNIPYTRNTIHNEKENK